MDSCIRAAYNHDPRMCAIVVRLSSGWNWLLLFGVVWLVLAGIIDQQFVERWLSSDGSITQHTRAQLFLFRVGLLLVALGHLMVWLMRRPLGRDARVAMGRLRAAPRPLHWARLVPDLRPAGLSRVVFVVWAVWILFCAFSLLGSDRPATRLTVEKGLLETAAALIYLCVGILTFAMAFGQFRRQRLGFAKWWLAILCLGSVFVALEEIDWGQQYLGYGTPPLMESLNYQREFAFHNIALPWVFPVRAYWANELLWYLSILGGIALPVFLLTFGPARRWLWAWEVPVPPWMSQAFFLSAAVIPRDKAVLGLYQRNNMPSELREFAIAFGVGIWLLVRFLQPEAVQEEGEIATEAAREGLRDEGSGHVPGLKES